MKRPFVVDRCSHELICGICGFMTRSPWDMIQHLANSQRYEEENCKQKIIVFKRADKNE